MTSRKMFESSGLSIKGMTTTFKISIALFVFSTLASPINAETNSTRESNAEEEEEKVLNVLQRNESFRVPLEDSTPNPNAEDKVIAIDGNALWNRASNFSEYDELHIDSKHDASPENSVDSLENVNYFLPENPDAETSTDTEIDELLSPTDSRLLLNNGTVSPTVGVFDLDDVVTVTSEHCAFGERKCRTVELVHTVNSESKLKDKSLLSTPSTFSSSSVPLWNIVKSVKPQEEFSSERSVMFSSVVNSRDFFSVTMNPAESSTAETSDNVILIDGTEVEKDESVIQRQSSNKSEKTKPVKYDDNLEEFPVDSTLLKVILTTPISINPKETPTLPADRPISPTPLTRIFEITSPRIGTPIQGSPSIVSVSSELVSKTGTEEFRDSDNTDFDKMAPSETYSKVSIEFSSPFPSSTRTDLKYNSKSNIQTNETKLTKQFIEKFSDVATSSPYFRESSSPVETTSIHRSAEVTIRSSLSGTFDVSSAYVIPSVTSDAFTPVLETEFTSRLGVKDGTTLATVKKEVAIPPRLSNPSCSSLPVCVEITLLETSWDQFCSQTHEFREFLSKSVSHYTRQVHPHHIVLDAEICTKSSPVRPLQSSPHVSVAFYVTDNSGEYEERLTEICGVVLKKWAPTAFRNSVIEVHLYNSESQSTPLPLLPELNSGFVAAVSISAVAGVALCLLCILLVVMKQKLTQGRNSDTTTPTADAYSLDSLSISASFRRRRNRRSARSYLNHAFNDQEIPSHPLNEKSLANCLKSRDLLEEEYKKIPMNMPKLDSIPEGAHVKNRYSNILPRAESRVVLAEPSGDPLKCYINANFVKGYGGKSSFYIACQAPLPEGIEDFWRMIWEQQSRVIVMLTMFDENGTARCAMYFPQSTLISQPPYGDFQVSLLKKDVYEFYTMSTLRLLDIEKNLFRDVVHLWFTGWPDVGVPKDPSSLITFVQQCRPYIHSNTGPTIVHCSTGTGRTGVFLSLDICMREYEESRSLDVLQCVSQLRRDRGGAVQNKDQYILLYEAMLEYCSRVANQSQCPSIGSKNSREQN